MPDHVAQIRRLFGASPITERKTMPALTRIVVDKSRISLRDMMSKSRRHAVTDPRHVAWYFCRLHVKQSLRQIGEFFDRDHGTIINGIRRIERMRLSDVRIDTLMARCEREIAGRWS